MFYSPCHWIPFCWGQIRCHFQQHSDCLEINRGKLKARLASELFSSQIWYLTWKSSSIPQRGCLFYINTALLSPSETACFIAMIINRTTVKWWDGFELRCSGIVSRGMHVHPQTNWWHGPCPPREIPYEGIYGGMYMVLKSTRLQKLISSKVFEDWFR